MNALLTSNVGTPWRIRPGLLEIQYYGNEDGVMDKNGRNGRRYSSEEKPAAVQMVRGA